MTLLGAPTNKRYTPQDLLRTPDNNSMELLGGQMIDKNSSVQSCEVETLFLFCIQSFLWTHPVAALFPVSLGYRCFENDPDRIRKPSASVILSHRMEQFADSDPDFIPIPPDLAIEVIAPKDTIFKVDERVAEYLSAGFPLVWVADPKARTITVHPLDGRPAIFTGDDEMTAEAALPGFRCKVRDFFPAVVAR